MVLALVLSLAGDVFLMLHGPFIPGLVRFLGAHLAYIALCRQGVPWFARRGALVATRAVGTARYALCGQAACPPPCADRWRPMCW